MKKYRIFTLTAFALFIVLIINGCQKSNSVEQEPGTPAKNLAKPNEKQGNLVKSYHYINSSNAIKMADPYVLKAFDGKFYCYATGMNVWSSDNLVDWVPEGNVKPENTWAAGGFWAPEVVEYKGKYYLYHTGTLKDKDSKRIGIAISDTPTGPFTDALGKPLIDYGYGVIDPHLFIDDDGSKYLYYSRAASEQMVDGKHESHIYGVELNEDMISIKGQAIVLSKPEQPWEKLSGPERFWNEGSCVLKNNGVYYLIYSANLYAASNYSVGYATAKHPLGPYTKYEHNPILSREELMGKVSGPGHNSVTFSPDGREIFMVYHSHVQLKGRDKKRKINIDRMGFRYDDTIYVNGPTITEQPMPSGSTDVYNIAPEAEVKVSSVKEKYRADAIIDGEIGIYKRFSNYDWVSTDKETESWVQLQWNRSRRVQSVWLYDSAKPERKISSGRLVFSNGYEVKDIHFPTESGAAAIVNFPEMEVEWVKFITSKLCVEEGEAGMSEIMVFSKETYK